MQKRILPLFFILFTINIVYGQGIQFFEGSWKEAMEKAKSEDKLLFVDAFAKWCGPCKAMAKNVFTQQKVGDFFNSNFINLKLDMEEADGVSFGHKYPVSAYPTLFFLDGDGKVVKVIKGGQQAEGLINLGADAIKSNDKSGNFAEKYEAGERDYTLVLNYVKALNQAGKPSLKISNDYLLSNPNITEEEKLLFIFEAAVDADSKLFDKFLQEKAKITLLKGEVEYTSKAQKACNTAVEKAIEFESLSILNDAISKAKKAFPGESEMFMLSAQMKYFKSVKDIANYTSAFRNLAKKASKDTDVLKTIIQDIILNFPEDKKMMSYAVEYAESVYKIEDNFGNLGMFCNVLSMKGDIQKAIQITTKAKEKAASRNEDLRNYDGLLNYLNSKKA